MLRLVLCLPCALKVEADPVFRFALFGPQGLTLTKEACLVTNPVEQFSSPEEMIAALPCDGGCGQTLGVSASSRWFLEQRAELHDRVHSHLH